jgi:plasmid maintenance system antidote protein VapI
VKKTTELLAIAKARNGDCSDYRLAQLLGVPQPTVSNYRIGRTLPADPIAAELGRLCGLDPDQVVCWVNIERAKDEATLRTWHSLLSRVQKTKPARLAA